MSPSVEVRKTSGRRGPGTSHTWTGLGVVCVAARGNTRCECVRLIASTHKTPSLVVIWVLRCCRSVVGCENSSRREVQGPGGPGVNHRLRTDTQDHSFEWERLGVEEGWEGDNVNV